MDIEMDLDIGLRDMAVPESDIVLKFELSSYDQNVVKPILSTPNDTSESNALEPLPEKVHLRGLDNLTTKDIKTFASEYFPSNNPSRVEWIDDTSANLVYETPGIAAAALASFAAVPFSDITQIPTLQGIVAKAFPAHPDTTLEVRLAVNGDRKQPGARERSRFYLMNPEHDPAERKKNGGHRGERTYRDRDDGGYRSQRYDDSEQRKRERETEFHADLYDDDEATREKRAKKNTDSRSPKSGNISRGRSQRVRFDGPTGKELFPDRARRGSGRLRDRSASPLADSDGDQDMREAERSRRQDDAATANRLKAQAIKAKLRDRGSDGAKELFPQKTGHRRSSAFDAADETANLFANRMPVPFVDGGNDSRRNFESAATGFSIRGAAGAAKTNPTFSIKGAARVKELFPNSFGDNSGKELFDERLEGRGRRRQRAEDLFY